MFLREQIFYIIFITHFAVTIAIESFCSSCFGHERLR